MNATVKNYEDVPLMLRVDDIPALMGVSRATAYNLSNTPGFPVIEIGRRKIIPRDKFFNWLENQAK